MNDDTEQEEKKRKIFEGMSPRRQERILKKGYEKWDPFLAPKEPPFYRHGGQEPGRDAGETMRRFLQEKQLATGGGRLSLEYVEGVREICFGLVRDESDRTLGMFDFCVWFFKAEAAKSKGGR